MRTEAILAAGRRLHHVSDPVLTDDDLYDETGSGINPGPELLEVTVGQLVQERRPVLDAADVVTEQFHVDAAKQFGPAPQDDEDQLVGNIAGHSLLTDPVTHPREVLPHCRGRFR